MSTCRRCGGPIVWTVSNNGKRLPVDLEPDSKGNVAVYRDHTGTLRSRVVTKAEPIATWEKPAMPHHATCPGTTPRPRKKPTPDGVVSIADARDAKRRQAYATKYLR